MTTNTWRIEMKFPRIVLSNHVGMTATVRSAEDNPEILMVSISDPVPSYARAEALRLLAQLWDTIGDLTETGDEALDVTFDVVHEDDGTSSLVVEGPDAAFVVIPLFSDDEGLFLLDGVLAPTRRASR